ncbi:NAD-dependent epimerase/dehydratase family protein [Afifella sp. JA880]|uniref:NAD-dependent epimerase/dehydratase family protein n=1 Tax=Afifella sp. JA880 TaxID=2975280 RepID=UPI0021BA836A|nr:NAD-dependent epimerase/dehydratase family protein [Afifella sp. JA880]MCT8266280.1 NAD-dependent epimerase/dehydratase family protein [Afifella sp. JA880]
MSERVLLTGGAGFIGRHVTAELVEHGYEVRVLDCLHPQVHGDEPDTEALIPAAELVIGDIRDQAKVEQALQGVDHVIHLAAEVGVGQSMYEINRYVSVNEGGTAVLLQALTKAPVERLVTASSMSIYGEGLYRNAMGEFIENAHRRIAEGNVERAWSPVDDDGYPLKPVATPEWKRPSLASVYALNKYAQEQMTLIAAPAYGIDAVALRLFNVYGAGQALSNPYTGVLAIFAARIRNGQPPMVFEDGEQRRDFVHVSDVARAFRLALEHEAAAGEIFNIGSGRDVSINDVARAAASALNRPDLTPQYNGKARAGDIRNCFADIDKAGRLLGFAPQVEFEAGLQSLAEWVAEQQAEDRTGEASRELEARGLVA